MRYHYTWLDSIDRDGDVELTSDTHHSEAQLEAAADEAYRLALAYNRANPETDEDGIPFEGHDLPDESQVLHYLTTVVLPDLAYRHTDARVMMPRGD